MLNSNVLGSRLGRREVGPLCYVCGSGYESMSVSPREGPGEGHPLPNPLVEMTHLEVPGRVLLLS